MKALPLLILACSLSTATPSSLATARGYLPSERFPRGQLFAKPWGPLRHLPPAPRLILRLGLRGGGGMSGDEQGGKPPHLSPHEGPCHTGRFPRPLHFHGWRPMTKLFCDSSGGDARVGPGPAEESA